MPHTPGPWTVGSHRTITSPAGTICETWSHMGIKQADANERLIAAAPDLLAALKVLVENGGVGPESMFHDARAAIAKAST